MYVSSQSPFYDDFSESKNFYRILFRPGRAVQARELTQLQTVLQKQIDNFGSNIFKEGSIVVPGSQVLDVNYKYIKLEATYNSISADDQLAGLVGQTIIGETTGVKALVINYAVSSDGDSPTLFVKYLNSGLDGETKTFADAEVIKNEAEDTYVQTISSAACGSGTAFSVGSGVIFVKGNFVYFDAQTLVVSKYEQKESFIAGFTVTESVIDSNDDSSLLDPAVGSYNYFAPGADRYKIALDLSSREFAPSVNDDPNFVELLRVQNKQIIAQFKTSSYNIINDTLARRTYDESGNYVVRPYRVEISEHLKTSDSVRDGIFTADQGGDANKFVGVISPGKSYVSGYELENILTQYVPVDKARDSVTITNSTIATEFGNYVYLTNIHSLPNLASLVEVDLYDQFTTAGGSSSGTKVGTARIRGIQFFSGTPGSSTAVYQAWLFDVTMNSGYTYERNVKQLYYNNTGFEDFTADIAPEFTVLTGSITAANTSPTILGTGTRFNSELVVGDYITFSSGTYRVVSIASDVSANISSNALVNVSGVAASRNQSSIKSTDKALYLFEFPYSTVKTVDPSDTATSYTTRRIYDRTLSGGNVSITSGTDETFAPYSTDNYLLINKSTGAVVDLTNKVTRTGSPTGKTITFSLGAPFTTEDVRIITSVQKSSSAANKKSKTLVADATVDFTGNTTATASVLSLGQADVLRIKSVKMSGNAFGTAYSTTNEVDITNRYSLDNGQRPTHYDIGTVTLKANQSKPTGPIRVTFDYFTHSSGDYFSVDSYADISYEEIPSFTYAGKEYQLRDCLDFRPRIDTDGITFTSPSEFLDFETDLLTDYEYYVPRIDKIVIDSTGNIKAVYGVSSLSPKEPATPSNSMALYVLKQKAYVFDVKNDIDVISIDNKRFTMRDIGRIENRVKNLEYYTTLSLLEKDTSLYQIKDALGFDRFKNGFVVDNFTGHKIGDTQNPDYGIAMDFNKGVLRPLFDQKFMGLTEISNTLQLRTSNNYAVTGNVATLPYVDSLLLQSNAASRVENINPFSVVNWVGSIELDPPADNWIDTARLPDIHVNREGNYNTLVAQSQARGTWGTVWGNWRDVWFGNQRSDTTTTNGITSTGTSTTSTTTTTTDVQQQRTGTEYTVTETIDVVVNNDVVVSRVVIPKMRSLTINFRARGLKPNTKVQAFFNDFRVTDFCVGNGGDIAKTSGGKVFLIGFSSNRGRLITDEKGELNGKFYYDASSLNFTTGDKTFRLTDSPTNGRDSETVAEAIFKSSGEFVVVRNEIVSLRNGQLSAKSVFDSRMTSRSETTSSTTYVNTTTTTTTTAAPTTTTLAPTLWDTIYSAGFGRAPDIDGVNYWANSVDFDTRIYTNVVASALGPGDLAAIANTVAADGSIDPALALSVVNVDGDYRQAYNAVRTIIEAGFHNQEQVNPEGLLAQHLALGERSSDAISYTAAQIVAAITLGQVSGGAETLTDQSWGGYIDSMWDQSNTISFSDVTSGVTTAFTTNAVDGYDYNVDPLAQTFRVGGAPITLSKLDLFFYDTDTSVPVFVELRKVIAGFPSEDVIPFSRVVLDPEDITITENGSTPTSIRFEAPVYLEPGEYAIVLLTNSMNYKVWISQVNERDVITNKTISEQPYVGVLFKSQNASTWTADQNQDLKFRLYNAEYDSSVVGTVDFEVDPALYQGTSLALDPIELQSGSTLAKVYHPNNGFINGSTVTLTGFPDTFYGIDVATIEGVEFTVSNVKQDSYTIVLPSVSNVTSTVRVGETLFATQDLKYDTLFPAIAALQLSGTKVEFSSKGTDVGYSLNSSFETITAVDDNEFENAKVLPSSINIANNLGNARPITIRATMTSDNRNLSPMIDLKQAGALFVKNIVNNPSYGSENLLSDIVTIASGSNVAINKLSDTEGYITLSSISNKANAVSIVKGTTVTLSNTVGSDGQFRVLDILDSGGNIKVYGNVATESAGNVITVTNGTAFVAEEAAFGGTALSKYITRQINFANPSTSFNVRLDACKPTETNVKLYYKTKLLGETSPLSEKEYVEITGVTIPQSLGGEFYEIETQIDNLPQFDAITFKIVLLSDDTAKVPKCKNLRIIALV